MAERTASGRSDNKLKGLDVVRAFACVGIFTFHTFLTLLGSFAVSIFFMLSGFLLVYNYYEKPGLEGCGLKDCARFSIKRVAKLYPLHVLTLCVMLAFELVMLRPAGRELSRLLSAFVSSLLLVQSWVPEPKYVTSLNGVSWYLSDMLFIYMCFPLLLRLIKSYHSRKSAWLAIGLTAGLMLISALAFVAAYDGIKGAGAAKRAELDTYFSYYLPIYRLGDFFTGCNLGCLFLTRDKRRLSAAKATVLELLAIGLAVLAQVIFRLELLPEELRRSFLFLLPSGLLIYSFALGQGHISGALDCRPVSFIAGLSTEIFLIHQVVIKLGTAVINMLPLPLWLMKWGGFAGILVMTLLLSWLYSRYLGTGRRRLAAGKRR